MPTLPNTLISQYADDTAYFYRGRSMNFLMSKVQKALDLLGEWTNQWRISINPEKSQALLFTWGRKRPRGNLTFKNIPIPWVENVQYLGISLDRRLTWALHVNNQIRKAQVAFIRLRPLLASTSKLSLSRKIHILRAVIIPKLTYGCPALPSHMKRLETTQSQMIRRIVGAPWFITNAQLREELKIPKIEHLVTTLAESQASRFNISLLQDPPDTEPPPTARRRRPRRRPIPARATSPEPTSQQHPRGHIQPPEGVRATPEGAPTDLPANKRPATTQQQQPNAKRPRTGSTRRTRIPEEDHQATHQPQREHQSCKRPIRPP